MTDDQLQTKELDLARARMRVVTWVVFGTGLLLTVGAALLSGGPAALATLIGAILATANLVLFARLGQAFTARKGGSPAGWGLLGAIKMMGLFFCFYLLLRRGDLPALGLVAGYAALPLGISLATLFRSASPTP